MAVKKLQVLITGATGGIGSEIARLLASQNHQLLVTGRDQTRLDGLLESLPGQGHCSYAADLNNEDELKNLVETARGQGINTLINCLGTGQLSLLEETTPSEIARILTTNLAIPIAICHSIIPYFRTLPSATIVNLGSILGSIGYAGSTLYCASKFGLRGFTESLRRELADSQIKLIYLAPRATDTTLNSDEMKQLNKQLGNRVDHPLRVARELSKLISRETSATRYLGWPESFFVRLNSLFPDLVDQSLKKQLSIIKQFAQSGKTIQ